MTRYFPDVVEAVLANFPDKCVVDGEIIVVRPGEDRLDFDLLQQRIHPAASRVKKLAGETPASFVAFDLLALGKRDLMGEPFEVRQRDGGSDACGGARRHPTISRLASEASTVLRPMPGSRKATVTSSSDRVSFEVTTMPSPQWACRIRSPSR